MRKRHGWIIGALGLLLLGSAGASSAAVSAEEAARLKKDLTPFGAERAGNADGNIPAWEGGLTGVPQGITFRGDGDFLTDPFADDKVLFSITAANVEQYADKLNPGQLAMFKKYPESYRIDVYPTRRTAAAPQWVYDNTFKNATSCNLTPDGLGIQGGYGGIPFPIPTRAEEVVYNHLVRWKGQSGWGTVTGGIVLPNGTFSIAGGGFTYEKFPYYQKDGSLETHNGDYWCVFQEMYTPERRKGEMLVVIDHINPATHERKAWQYLPGQRRVRRAPTLAYDTPDPSAAGLTTYDDNYQFNGALDRFDWKLVGKKEMYIPYNGYRSDLAPRDEYLTPHHLNPDVMRWELHRVWVVEATLKEGKRHCYGKRVLYLDEDSWTVALSDRYDLQGNLWRTGLQNLLNYYSLPALRDVSRAFYDLQTDTYSANSIFNGEKEYIVYGPVPDEEFTSEALRRKGRR